MTGHEIWVRLQDIFESRGAVGVVNLRREFFRTFAEDGANMEEHIRKLRGLWQELSACGQSISDSDFAKTLLTSLPYSWLIFIAAVNAGGMAVSFNVLISRILDEDWARQAGIAWQTVLSQIKNCVPQRANVTTVAGKDTLLQTWAKGAAKKARLPSGLNLRIQILLSKPKSQTLHSQLMKLC